MYSDDRSKKFMKWNKTSLLQWVLALIVSLTLWVLSLEDNPFEINDILPLSQEQDSQDFILINGLSRDSVHVTFTGMGIGVLRDQIMRSPESVQINVAPNDQSQVFPVSISRELTENNITFSGDRYTILSVVEFSPGSIEFNLDRKIVRNLPVAITSSSSIPERYYWSISSDSSVEVEGAESIVNQLDSCYTVAVDPGMDEVRTAIVKPEGIVYISPSSILAELVPPVEVITQLE